MTKQTYDNYYREYYKNNKDKINKKRAGKRREASKRYYEKAKLDNDENNKTYSREWRLWYGAKWRAKEVGLPFDIELSDIIIPDICPILGIQIDKSYTDLHKEHAPSLDKVIPEKGYVKGNVCVISRKANRMKQDLTLDSVELIKKYIIKYSTS